MIPAVDKVYSGSGLTGDVLLAVAANPRLRMLGWSIRESAGSAAVATVRIMRGATVAGSTTIAFIELAANASAQEWYGPQGIEMQEGITVDHITGTIDLTIFWTA
jgi:hypothetical protein